MTRHGSQISRGVESIWARAQPGWGGLALAVVLLASAALSVSPLQDAVTGSAVSFAHQTRPIAYLLGAPLFDSGARLHGFDSALEAQDDFCARNPGADRPIVKMLC